MTAARVPHRDASVRLVRNGDDGVLVDGDGVERCLLNVTAVAVWELCDGVTTDEEMARAFSQLWDVTYSKALDDLTAALEVLAAAKVVTW